MVGDKTSSTRGCTFDLAQRFRHGGMIVSEFKWRMEQPTVLGYCIYQGGFHVAVDRRVVESH